MAEKVRCTSITSNQGLATKHCSNRVNIIYSAADGIRTLTSRNGRISINGKPLKVGNADDKDDKLNRMAEITVHTPLVTEHAIHGSPDKTKGVHTPYSQKITVSINDIYRDKYSRCHILPYYCKLPMTLTI